MAALVEIAEVRAGLNVRESGIELRLTKLDQAIHTHEVDSADVKQHSLSFRRELRSARDEKQQLEVLAECILVGPPID